MAVAAARSVLERRPTLPAVPFHEPHRDAILVPALLATLCPAQGNRYEVEIFEAFNAGHDALTLTL